MFVDQPMALPRSVKLGVSWMRFGILNYFVEVVGLIYMFFFLKFFRASKGNTPLELQCISAAQCNPV